MHRQSENATSLEMQLRRACAELDRTLRAGSDCRAEQFLQRLPELAADEPSAVELIYAEFVARESCGQEPSCEAFYQRFPQWREGLEEQFQIHRLVAGEEPQRGGPPATSRTARDIPSTANARHRLGMYELGDEIGRGSAGVVYKARQRGLNRPVAVKVISAGGEASSRLKNEANAVARLQHPNIVQVFEVGEDEGRPYLVLEFVPGGTLSQKLSGKPYPPYKAAELVLPLARAIDYAHQQGVVHRDLKPGNMLLADNGTVKITDFGIARILDCQQRLTETGQVFGTPSYMAPEQAAGQRELLGPAVDVYSLGAILYELLTGRPPFLADSPLATLHQVASKDAVSPDRLQPGVPRDLAVICMKCLEKEPRRRYATAGELADDLQRLLRGEPIHARPAGFGERAWKWARRRPAAAALVGVSVTALGLLVAGVLVHNAQLSVAIDDARQRELKAQQFAAEADRQRAQSLHQSELARQQLDTTRRSLYTIQLNQAQETWRTDPDRALALLQDEQRCPLEFRDLAWGILHYLSSQDRVLPTGGTSSDRIAMAASGLLVLATAQGTIKTWQPGDEDERAISTPITEPAAALAVSADGRVVAWAGQEALHRVDLETGASRNTPTGGDFPPLSAAFSPSGKWLAVGSRLGGTRLLDARSLSLEAHAETRAGPVRGLAFSPDESMLIVAGANGTTGRWQVPSLNRMSTARCVAASPAGNLALSADTKRLVFVENAGRSLSVWDTEAGMRKAASLPLVEKIHAVAFSPDGRTLATGSEDYAVRLWDAETGVEKLALLGHSRPVRQVVYFPDGNTLASLADDRTVRLWALGTRGQQDVLSAHAAALTAMAFSPLGHVLAAGGADGLVQLWDARGHDNLGSLAVGHGPIWSLAFAPQGDLLAAASEDGSVSLWSVSQQREMALLEAHRQRVWCAAFSADSSMLVTAGQEGFAKLWDVASRSVRQVFENRGTIMAAVALSHDDTRLVAAGGDGLIRLWDVATGAKLATLKGHQNWVLTAAFSPDDKWLVTGGMDSLVFVWDTRTLERKYILAGHSSNVISAAFTPDATTLITGSGSRRGRQLPGEVKLWDLSTGQCRATFADQTGPVALSGDARILATVSNSVSVRLWYADPVAADR